MRPTLQPLQPTHVASTLANAAPRASRLRAALLATIVLAAAAFATLSSAPSSSAASLASKQAQASKLDAELRKIEEKYDHLQERYRGAQYELDRLKDEVEQAHRVVVATRRDLGVAKVNLAARASAIYRTGGANGDLAELASAGSFTDFFERMDSMRRIGSQDATVLETVEALNARVERKERTLRTAKAKAARVTAQARRAKDRLGELRAARRAKLDGVNAEIRSILDAQRQAAAARAAAAARESASLARPDEVAGSTPTGGSSSDGSSPTLSIPLPPGSSTAAAAANIAMGKIGTPYLWGGSGPDSFDCSGLVMWAFAQAGRPGLPHSTYSLINMGVEVPLDQLQVGDLVFPSHLGHVGMYVGGGSFVHAPSSGDVVKVTSMSDYSISRARRL